MISQYFPILWTIVAVHLVAGASFFMLKVKPKLDSGDIPEVDGSGFAKISMIMEVYAATYADRQKKPWDYYYARVFKVLHLIVIVIIAACIVDVALSNMQSAE